MTQKQMLIFLFGWILTVGIFGFGFNWFMNHSDCNLEHQMVIDQTNNQDQWLYNYGVFSLLNLKPGKLKNVKKNIEFRERLVKTHIEHFAKTCRSKLNKNRLMSILKGHEYYLKSKQVLFKETQDFKWIVDTIPFEYAEDL